MPPVLPNIQGPADSLNIPYQINPLNGDQKAVESKTPRRPDLGKLRSSIEGALGLEISDLEIHEGDSRLFSTVWEIQARTADEEISFIVKDAGERASRQAWLARQAEELTYACPDAIVPRVIHLAGEDLLLIERFEGQPMSGLCSYHPFERPLGWLGDLARALDRAGNWLARYHRATHGEDSDPEALLAYILTREQGLAVLDRHVREKLLDRCRLGFTHGSVVTHGDFTPWNVLVREASVAVIDFGIKEWVRMSPFWDLASMIVGLQRQLLFSWRSPIRWYPPRFRALADRFAAAYGQPFEDQPDFHLCLAARHFSFLFGHQQAAEARSRRAVWHRAQITTALQRS